VAAAAAAVAMQQAARAGITSTVLEFSDAIEAVSKPVRCGGSWEGTAVVRERSEGLRTAN
jgi:hypothetical protein